MAFREQYNIDLATEFIYKRFTWVEFKTLLKGVNDKTLLGKVIQSRIMDISTLLKPENAMYRNLKRQYPIKDNDNTLMLNEGKDNNTFYVSANQFGKGK